MTFLVLLSVLLMILDNRSPYFNRLEAKAAVIALPLQYMVNTPARFTQWLGGNMTTQHQIIEENARLRAEQLLLQAKLQHLIALENENVQLRALLQSSPHVGGTFTVAQLLAVNMDPFVQQVILDKGQKDRVYVGQPVFDAYGVMGQVIKVGVFTSTVLLITDPRSGISVQDSRNGIRAIAQGMGNGMLQLINVPDQTDIQGNDLMVTSGLDQRFPAGYPVGIVNTVKRDPELRFANLQLTPSAHIDRSRMVLLIWPGGVSNAESTPAATATAVPAADTDTTGKKAEDSKNTADDSVNKPPAATPAADQEPIRSPSGDSDD